MVLRLNHLSGESFQLRLANTEDGAHLDVVANGFWEHGQNAYMLILMQKFLILSLLHTVQFLYHSATGVRSWRRKRNMKRESVKLSMGHFAINFFLHWMLCTNASSHYFPRNMDSHIIRPCTG